MKENKTPFFLQNPFASLGNLKQCWEICSGLSSRVIIWERRCGKACTGLAEVGGHPADIANQTAEPHHFIPLHFTLPTAMWGFLSSARHCENAFVEFKCCISGDSKYSPVCLHYGVDPYAYIPLRLNPTPQCRYSYCSGAGTWCGSDRPPPGVVPHTSAAAIWDLWHNSTRKRTQ